MLLLFYLHILQFLTCAALPFAVLRNPPPRPPPILLPVLFSPKKKIHKVGNKSNGQK